MSYLQAQAQSFLEQVKEVIPHVADAVLNIPWLQVYLALSAAATLLIIAHRLSQLAVLKSWLKTRSRSLDAVKHTEASKQVARRVKPVDRPPGSQCTIYRARLVAKFLHRMATQRLPPSSGTTVPRLVSRRLIPQAVSPIPLRHIPHHNGPPKHALGRMDRARQPLPSLPQR